MYSLTTYQGIRQTAEIICGSRDWDVVFPQAIESVESDINKKLIIGELVTVTTLTAVIGQDYVVLAGSLLEIKSVVLIDSTYRTAINPASKELFAIEKCSGAPALFYVEGSKLVFDVKASKAYSIEVTLYSSALTLTEIANANIVTLKYPNLYLYGVAAFLFMISQEPVLEAEYRNKFDKEIFEAKYASARKQSQPRLRMAGSRAGRA